MPANVTKLEKDSIVKPMLKWFGKTNRDLPWRKTYNPYHIWISEIMLQQTQMDRGVNYFLRWIERFPDAETVASADEQEILKYWEGLGYYARARNLHKAAKEIINAHGGEVPCDYKVLLGLPGVGPYTAAAIASVAGNQDVAVIDANVTRVYARLFDIAESVKERRVQQQIGKIADQLLPIGQARGYNQALMDLGGLICRPKSPLCAKCPIAASCMAFRHETVSLRPVLAPKKKIVVEEWLAVIVMFEDKIYIQQRPEKGVWGGLWEFPGGKLGNKMANIEKGQEGTVAEVLSTSCGLAVKSVKALTTVFHQYTHHKIILHSYVGQLNGSNSQPDLYESKNYRWVSFKELNLYGFPAGPRKILEYIRNNKLDIFSSFS